MAFLAFSISTIFEVTPDQRYWKLVSYFKTMIVQVIMKQPHVLVVFRGFKNHHWYHELGDKGKTGVFLAPKPSPPAVKLPKKKWPCESFSRPGYLMSYTTDPKQGKGEYSRPPTCVTTCWNR